MSHGRGGLRSGPTGNKQWAPAFEILEVMSTSSVEKHHFHINV